MPRRWKVVAIAAAVVVVVGGGAVVADFGLRAFAEQQVRSAVTSKFPASVTGDVSVVIGGGSFLQQYASGRFDEVTITSQHLEVDGHAIEATVVANDVSPDQTKPVPRASVTVKVDQATLNSFVTIPGSDTIVLGDGTVGYQGRVDFLGLALGYDATATAAPSGPDVLLTPTGATLSAGSASVDVGGVLKALVQKPLSICVAQYLPAGVQITSITPSSGFVVLQAEATNLTLTEDALRTTGSCS